MNSELMQIPKRIKELREILEISAMEMASRLNIGLEQYNKLENGEKDIPISTLYEIASILGTDCTVLLTGESPRMNTHTVVRKGEGVSVDRYAGYHFESLAYNFIGREMEPMLVTLEVKEVEPALVMHGGQEFNFVLQGTVKVTVGNKSFILNEGDCIYFNPSLPHGQAAVGGTTKFLTVINE
jgi:mannose-6-phosphate isomerase-like protein (cupin superfamily)